MDELQHSQDLDSTNFTGNWGLLPAFRRKFRFRTVNEANSLLHCVISHLNDPTFALSAFSDLHLAWNSDEIELQLDYEKGKSAEISENCPKSSEIEQYRLGKELCRFNSANYRVICNESWSQSSGKPVLLKRCGPISSQKEANLPVQEGFLQALGRHSSICAVTGLFLTAHSSGFTVNIVLERCERDLEQDITKRKLQCRPYTDSNYRNFLYCAATALTHLKSLNIAHRNLKPAAVFLASEDYKVGNFSCAGKGQWTTEGRGTAGYLSPETAALVAGTVASVDVYASDVYSLGLVLLHMALMDLTTIDGDPRPLIEKSDLQADLKQLVAAMLDPLPLNRPLIDTIPFAVHHNSDIIISTGTCDLIFADLLTYQERFLLSPTTWAVPASASFYANAYYRQGALTTAEKLLVGSLQAGKPGLDPENRYVHYRLAKIYVEMEEFEKAVQQVGETLAVVKVLFGENSEKVAYAYTLEAQILMKMGKYAEAEGKCMQSVAILRELPYIAPRGPGRAECIATLALIFARTGRQNVALALAKSALQAEWPEKHQIDVISGLLTLSKVYFLANSLPAAYQIALESLELLQPYQTSYVSLYFQALTQLSEITTEQGDWSLAAEYTRKAFAAGERSGGAFRTEMAGDLARMSEIAGKSGDFGLAVSSGRKAALLLGQSREKTHIREAIRAYCSLAVGYSGLNSPAQAAEAVARAAQLAAAHFPQDSALLQGVRLSAISA